MPPAFQPALMDWDAAGMPPGNITLIPRIHQCSGAPEYVTAWFGNEVCIQRMAGGKLDVWRIRPRDVMQVRYSIQLLKCTVTVWLKDGGCTGFSYNKTKEDQFYPVLNRNFLYILQRRPDPECFCAVTDASPVCIITGFYSTRVLYLPDFYGSLQVKPLPHGKGSGLYLRTLAEGESLYFCLMPGQEEAADAFARRWFFQPEEGASR